MTEKNCEAVYTTRDLSLARRLLAAGRPCIYIEEGAPVWGIPYTAAQEGLDVSYLSRVWHRHYHRPLIIAQTRRLMIRESVPEDIPQLLRLYAREQENPDIAMQGEDAEEQMLYYMRHRYELLDYGLWTLVERSSGNVIGRVGLEEMTTQELMADAPETSELRLELAYMLHEGVRGRGYGREAVDMLLAYAAEALELTRVYLRTSPANDPSNAIARSCHATHLSAGADRILYGIDLQ
ncbi:MAG: GNAT family N-acetyltransferase [Eubacteriales bacterium]|nr:GNAT family N-acetyltransferase [Eubacteriales bacterium]